MSIVEQQELYKILHLSGYYDGIESVNVIKEGFNHANAIIEKIRPLSPSCG